MNNVDGMYSTPRLLYYGANVRGGTNSLTHPAIR